jgi:hypothetical protein
MGGAAIDHSRAEFIHLSFPISARALIVALKMDAN